MSLKARLAKLEQHYPIAADDLSAMTDLELDAQIERLYGLLAPAEREEADRLLAANGIYLTGGRCAEGPGLHRLTGAITRTIVRLKASC